MKNEKVDMILKAAKKVFEKYGYQKTSMEDIAREAMIGKGTIYYYFNSKEDIYLAILNQISSDISIIINKLIDSEESLEQKLKIYFIKPFEYLQSHKSILLVAFGEESPVFLKKINEFKEQSQLKFKERLLKIFSDAKENGRLRKNIENKINKVSEVIFRWLTLSGENVKISQTIDWIEQTKRDLDLFADIIINGIIKKEE